eukprot:15456032-Alexandrium_andersonii.AAC.1
MIADAKKRNDEAMTFLMSLAWVWAKLLPIAVRTEKHTHMPMFCYRFLRNLELAISGRFMVVNPVSNPCSCPNWPEYFG